MTFQMQAAGTREQVAAQLDAVTFWGDPTYPGLVRDLVHRTLALAEFKHGVFVEASGHQDTDVASLSLSIRPLNLPAPPAVAVNVTAAPAAVDVADAAAA